MPSKKSLILFIDAYDSYSNNIISVLETALEVSVRTVKIDNPALASDHALHAELRNYVAIVCGPGPGRPGREEDVGVMRRIWKLDEQNILPVLGICLGFQSLCREFGGNVKRLKGPQHGMIRRVTHIGEANEGKDTIFAGVGEIFATHYQSLCVDIGHESLAKEEFTAGKWKSTMKCPDLVPLAWAEWDSCEDNDSGKKDEKILVAVQHKEKPFWALQYHPESICTNAESGKIIKNWFEETKKWNHHSRKQKIKTSKSIVGESAVRESLLHRFDRIHSSLVSCYVGEQAPRRMEISDIALDYGYRSQSVTLPDHMTVPDIVELIQDTRRNQIILESTNAHETSADVRGRYSIIALDVDSSVKFEYSATTNRIKILCPLEDGNGDEIHDICLKEFGGIWPFLAQFLEKRQIPNGNLDSPFWGGFMGYTTYEMGLEGIEVRSEARKTSHGRPDFSFAWITRSLVVDHEKNLIYIQDLSKKDSDDAMPPWMTIATLKLGALALPNTPYYVNSATSLRNSGGRTASSSSSISLLQASASTDSLTYPAPGSRSPIGSVESSPERTSYQNTVITIKTPSDSDYEAKVRSCQEYISSGDSYELCLTDQTTVQRYRFEQDPRDGRRKCADGDAWSLYRTLRTRQPAPFASYVRLGSATLVSSSPERFLTWSADGNCELRPMKGTVRKSATVSTFKQASALLDVPKEKAENLMIVDLVRHDLHGVCGSGNVSVPRLMAVEEYRSVFQMISIVRGHIPRPIDPLSHETRYTGLDVLAASLPPGSMTGAPKKRSCEILQEIEGKERSLYSGVVGYMDVGGRGDWSVTIRSMFRWDDECIPEERELGRSIETWHIGAGGAVTALSTPEGEREEMQTKLNGTLGIFR